MKLQNLGCLGVFQKFRFPEIQRVLQVKRVILRGQDLKTQAKKQIILNAHGTTSDDLS